MNVWRSKKFHTADKRCGRSQFIVEWAAKPANHFIKKQKLLVLQSFSTKLLQKKGPHQDDLIKESKRHAQRGKQDGNMTYVSSVIVKITVFTSLDTDVLFSQMLVFISATWITSHLWHNCYTKPIPILDVLLLINFFPPQPRTKSIWVWMFFKWNIFILWTCSDTRF